MNHNCTVTHRDGSTEHAHAVHEQDGLVTVRFKVAPKRVPGRMGWQIIDFSYRDIPKQYVSLWGAKRRELV